MAENGKFIGEKGKGRFLKQKPYSEAWKRYKPREDDIEANIEKYKRR